MRNGKTLVVAPALAALSIAAAAGADLVAFSAGQAARQGNVEIMGTPWSCAGELCRGSGPDDAALWPGVCAALVREIGPVVAFGTLKQRLDADQLGRCNREASARTPDAPAAPVIAPTPAPTAAPTPTPAPTPITAPEAEPNREICNGRDDDGDGEVDEGVQLTVWQDRDRDLYGDRAHSRRICAHQLAPGWVIDDSDCDDADRRRNPARDNCP